METMRTYSKALTEPSENPSEPPLHRYTLRGVCTEPHVTYVLKRNDISHSGDAMEVDGENNNGYQWWRISFSTEDGKTRQAEKREAQGDKAATQNGDVVGYTARKVREIEVLRAAREEWRSVLLVYASDNAMRTKVDAAPPQLQVRSLTVTMSWYELTSTRALSTRTTRHLPPNWSRTLPAIIMTI